MSTWNVWIERHATLFVLRKDADLASLAAWAKRFAAAGMTPEELLDASEWLALHPPAFLSQHLAALISVVNDRRFRQKNANAAQARREAEPEPIAGDCSLCAGTGLVQGLTWTKRNRAGRPVLACISCRCEAGVTLHRRRLEAGYPLRSLDEHEVWAPDWRTRKPEAKAVPDTGLGAAIERILEQAKAKAKAKRK